MEIASAAVGECTKSTIVHVEREFGYLIHFRKSTHTLKGKIQQLTATKSDVQAMIDAAVRNGESIKETVQDWMTRADLVLGQAAKLSNEASIIKCWFRGWCCGRFSLGRKAEKKILVIQELSIEGSGFGADDVSYRMPTPSLTLVGLENFNAFASRDFTAEKIRTSLLDDSTNLVGVYGMPGVGKTTLIEAIAKQVKEEKLFQEVVLVTVSQEPNLMKLQGNIAEILDLKDLGVDLSVRAGRLFKRLNQDDKTTLVILDDVWKRIELSKVGIPYKNKGKCCKIVFTTRFRDVCETMEADTKIEVAVLLEEDSWILFQQKSGNVADSALARDLSKECSGLPLALVTLGRALRNKDEVVWADTLVQLQKSILKGMSSVVSSIKLSYNFLESEFVKTCLLFCCLFPEDHKIKLEVLLSYVMGEKILEDVDTYEEARSRLHGVMDELVSSGLLLRDEKGEVMMHDVVRDVSISIAAEEKSHIVKAGRNLREWPDMELGNCKRLSMMQNPIDCLPTVPIKAPFLKALFLNANPTLPELPSDFFAGMKSLMTLDLSETAIESLPPSLSCLENLATLLLNNTNLNNLSPIEKLERLEILSLRYFRYMGEFPEELGNNLKLLDLNGSWVEGLKPNLISKLHRLDALHFFWDGRSNWDNSDIIEFGETNLLREVGSLSRLTSLELRVTNEDSCCQVDIPGPWENLTRFRILATPTLDNDFGETQIRWPNKSRYVITDIDTKWKGMYEFRKFSKSMLLDKTGGKVANWVLVLLGRTNYLQLRACNDLQSLTELGAGVANGMNENLKSLYLRECDNMECLVSSSTGLFQSYHNACLSNLKELEIRRMDGLLEICKGTPPPRLLYNLKTLSLFGCERLVSAIPRKLIHNLQNLEELDVLVCKNLLYIVQMEEEEESIVSPVLPIFHNLKVVGVSNIPIKYVFTMRVVRNLLLLEHLEIKDCREMEVIFKYEDGEDIQFNRDTAILPRLKKLTVWDAPQLKSFTNHNLVMELPSLETLDVYNCFILERLPFGTTSVPNLKIFGMDQFFSNTFNRMEWEDESVKARLEAFLD